MSFPGPRKRKSKPRPIGDFVGGVLEDLGLGEVARAARVGEHWTEAVGTEVAAHARPQGMRGAVLEVQVDTSVWCQQLQLRRPELLAALR